jgi:hypothetical protein
MRGSKPHSNVLSMHVSGLEAVSGRVLLAGGREAHYAITISCSSARLLHPHAASGTSSKQTIFRASAAAAQHSHSMCNIMSTDPSRQPAMIAECNDDAKPWLCCGCCCASCGPAPAVVWCGTDRLAGVNGRLTAARPAHRSGRPSCEMDANVSRSSTRGGSIRPPATSECCADGPVPIASLLRDDGGLSENRKS